MGREVIEHRSMTGSIKVSCKYDDGTVRVWQDEKSEVVGKILAVVDAYKKQGYKLTLRQLYYQLVSRNWIINHDSAYKKLGNILDDCRYSGYVDWDDIEDRGRRAVISYSADDLADGLNDLKNQYRLDRQEGQKNYIELWTEKDALSGILGTCTHKYHIHLCVNKGYTSSSAIYQSYKRFFRQLRKGKSVTVLYFGDHDPSGLDMVRDIEYRLKMFLTRGDGLLMDPEFSAKVNDWWFGNNCSVYDLVAYGYMDDKICDRLMHGSPTDNDNLAFDQAKYSFYLDEHNLFNVKAIGLTMEQINEFNLPPNPAKLTDARAAKYVEQHGKYSWEVDALTPKQLVDIVEGEIEELMDMGKYYSVIEREDRDKDNIDDMIAKGIW